MSETFGICDICWGWKFPHMQMNELSEVSMIFKKIVPAELIDYFGSEDYLILTIIVLSSNVNITLSKSRRIYSIYTGQNTFPILLLNDDKMLGEHKGRKKILSTEAFF